jgi:hypothetical protein
MKKIAIVAAAGAALLVLSGCQKEAETVSVGIGLSEAEYPPGADYPIRPKPFSEVALRDRFWRPKIRTNAAVTIPLVIRRFAETGRPMNANVLQAAVYSLQTHPDEALRAEVEARVREIMADSTKPAGPEDADFEVAAAYFKATGKRDLLDAAIAAAALIYERQAKESPPFSGRERDAIHCVELYRVTREKRHLDLAKRYLAIRGLENSVDKSRHNQSHRPVLDQDEAVGHAVNAASLMVSLADVGALTGIRDYADAALRLWRDVVEKKLYITGGIGSTGNEGFGAPYDLPNISAYCETCAGIMFAAFCHKMFLATGDGRHIDVLERALYNNVLSGVSASGDRFFYVNRLASAGDGRDVRWEWASLPCCPPNLVRFLATMPGYIYAADKDGVYVNLYVSSDASFVVNGKTLSLSVDSEMPWGGRTTLKISAEEEAKANLRLRIPGWARNRPVPGGLYVYLGGAEGATKVSLNGEEAAGTVDPMGYLSLDRTWKNGDVAVLELPFEVRRVVADPRVKADRGKMALERGPIVYCAEGPDCGGGKALELLFDPGTELKPSFEEDFFGGAAVLRGEARSVGKPSSVPKPITLIPYHLWANRGAGEMSVWLSKEEYALGDTGPAGGLIFHVNPNSAADGWRYLEAAPFDQSAGAGWGCFRTAIPGARGSAVGAGRQNTRDILAACPAPGTAAELCANLNLHGFRDWFLPSIDELAEMYVNLKLAGRHDFGDREMPDNFNYWSSTQVTADMARHLDFADNGRRRHYDDKDFPRRVRAVRAF